MKRKDENGNGNGNGESCFGEAGKLAGKSAGKEASEAERLHTGAFTEAFSLLCWRMFLNLSWEISEGPDCGLICGRRGRIRGGILHAKTSLLGRGSEEH